MQPDKDKYLSTLLLYYEEEIMGEAYFNALADGFPLEHQKQKMRLLAAIERYAANSVTPLINKYGLKPRPDEELHKLGNEGVDKAIAVGWNSFIDHMVEYYPEYMPEFHALEAMAPQEDQEYLQIFTQHEVAAIEFAKMEQAGDASSSKPLHSYLQSGSV